MKNMPPVTWLKLWLIRKCVTRHLSRFAALLLPESKALSALRLVLRMRRVSDLGNLRQVCASKSGKCCESLSLGRNLLHLSASYARSISTRGVSNFAKLHTRDFKIYVASTTSCLPDILASFSMHVYVLPAE